MTLLEKLEREARKWDHRAKQSVHEDSYDQTARDLSILLTQAMQRIRVLENKAMPPSYKKDWEALKWQL